MGLNPFKGRRPGVGAASAGVKLKGATLSVKEANAVAVDVLQILRNHPETTDEKLMEVLNLPPTNNAEAAILAGRQAYEKELLMAGAATNKSTVNQVKNGDVTLVTFSPEQVLHQVEERRSRVSFDLSGTAKFMDNFNQVWSWVGPILFAAGTIGEIFLVLWSRQTEQSYFAAFSIVAVSMIAEGTLLAISFAAKRLRNRADKRSTGWTDKETHKLETLKRFWFLLMLCVAATQVAFILAQTKSEGIGLAGLWAVAIVRAFSAGVADAYTAFVSEEKPTSGDMAIEQQDRETQFLQKLLDQEALKVEVINSGSIKVQEQAIEASIRQDRLKTQEEIARRQNAAQIESMKTEQEQKVLIDRMRNSAMRAIFDPEMPTEQRQVVINMLTGLMGATSALPPGHIDRIEEEGL